MKSICKIERVLLTRSIFFLFNKYCLFHVVSHFQNLSSTISQTCTNLKRVPEGRSDKWLVSTLQPNPLVNYSKLGNSPTRVNSLFSKLNFKVEIASNHMKVQLMHSIGSLLASQRIKVLSTNKRLDNFTPSPHLLAPKPLKNLLHEPSSIYKRVSLLP